ncbi:DUF899 domain-containing protein [soil metagenome]
MKSLHDKQFPNDSKEYRKARNELLEAEMALRIQIENVAKMRRSLPLGGKVKEDYVFMDLAGEKRKLSELFEDGKDTLLLYSMMFDPSGDVPCQMCNSLVDGLTGNAHHITQKVNLAVIGKAPIEKIRTYAKQAGWDGIQLLSSFENTYNVDYFGEIDGEQQPIMNVFVKKEGAIYHTWGSELCFAIPETGQDPRAMDSIWPLYNIFDLTPEGRENYYPDIPHNDNKSSCNCGNCDCK